MLEEHAIAHTTEDKTGLLNRVSRIRGQVEAIHRGLAQEDDCNDILQMIAACRGAINGLMAEVIEGHIQSHVVSPKEAPGSERAKATKTLIKVMRTYLK